MLVTLQRGALLFFLISATSARAQNGPLTFEGYADGTILSNQYGGVLFGNAIFLAAGITLNELENPPSGGNSVASDNGGPMSLVFSSAVRALSGHFTYTVPLSLQAFDAGNNLVATATSAYSNNEALSGVSGSHPNELIQVSSSTNIHKVVITGSALGTSFTIDDAAIISACDLNRDSYTNVRDLQAIVNQALGIAPPTADLTGDGAVNAVDVQILMNAALNLGCKAT